MADKRKAEELGRIVPTVDYITFCSSSAVRAFVDMYGQNAMDAKVICIGPVTAKTAQSQGLDVYKTAKQYDIDGLIERILEDQI